MSAERFSMDEGLSRCASAAAVGALGVALGRLAVLDTDEAREHLLAYRAGQSVLALNLDLDSSSAVIKSEVLCLGSSHRRVLGVDQLDLDALLVTPGVLDGAVSPVVLSGLSAAVGAWALASELLRGKADKVQATHVLDGVAAGMARIVVGVEIGVDVVSIAVDLSLPSGRAQRLGTFHLPTPKVGAGHGPTLH